MIISIINIKGGVGKTATAVNLAACAIADGRELCCVDLDAQRDFTVFAPALDGATFNVQILPPTKSTLTVIDCAPFLNAATKPALSQSTLVLIPMQPDFFAYRGAERILKDLKAIAPKARAKVLLTMCDRDSRDDENELQSTLKSKLCATRIPRSPHIKRSFNAFEPVVTFAPRSAVTRAYKQLWRELNGLD